MLRYLALLLCLALFVPGLRAQTNDEQFEQAAAQLWDGGKVPHDKPLALNILSRTTQAQDRTAKRLESSLSLALSRQGFALVRAEESLSGIGSETTVLKGSYLIQGNRLQLELRAQHAISGQVFDQVELNLINRQRTGADLFAVLDIESKDLNKAQLNFFSDDYRSALRRIAKFKVASSGEVDKMDPEQVQKTLGCTRDECATVIGEQMGVDRVVSTSMVQIDEGLYGLTSTVINIEDGLIAASATIKHQGRLSELDRSLEALARDLAGQLKQPAPKPMARKRPEIAPAPRPEPPRKTPDDDEGAFSMRIFGRDQTTTFSFDWSDDSYEELTYEGMSYGLRLIGNGAAFFYRTGTATLTGFDDNGQQLTGWTGEMTENAFGFEAFFFSRGPTDYNQLTFNIGLGWVNRNVNLTTGNRTPVEFTTNGMILTVGLDYVSSIGLFIGLNADVGLVDTVDFKGREDLNQSSTGVYVGAVGVSAGISF